MDPRPVVIAYDGSDRARAAIAYAGEVLRYPRAVVVCVWAPVEPVVPAATIAAPSSVAVAGGRSRTVAAVLGSTAEGILRHAHRSVMVVPDS